jgi:hypothetical protein
MKNLASICFAAVLAGSSSNCSIAQAATIKAASTSQADVQAAVRAARNGDTVVLPAGDSTWRGTVTITKNITLQGQGINSTFLREHLQLLILSPAVNAPIRITGIYFDGSPFGQVSGEPTNRVGIAIYKTCTQLRIDNCYFNNWNPSIHYSGKIYGVTDHCTFHNGYVELQFSQDLGDFGAADWRTPIHPGGLDTMVVEDCTFLVDVPGTKSDFIENRIYGQAGGRACIRHNTFTFKSALPMIFDAHGESPNNGNAWGHSTHFYEVYNNTFNCKYTYRFWNLRGGIHIFHDNAFNISGSQSEPLFMGVLREDVGYPSGSGATQELIEKSFAWNNTYNGSPIAKSFANDGSTNTEPVENVDFFNRPIHSGDPWYPYTPLTYPHPLTSGKPVASGPSHKARPFTAPRGHD